MDELVEVYGFGDITIGMEIVGFDDVLFWAWEVVRTMTWESVAIFHLL